MDLRAMLDQDLNPSEQVDLQHPLPSPIRHLKAIDWGARTYAEEADPVQWVRLPKLHD